MRCVTPTLLLVSCRSRARPRRDDGWRSLWNGKDFSVWSTFLTRPDPSWDVHGLSATRTEILELIGKNRDPLRFQREGRRAAGDHITVRASRDDDQESFGIFRLRLQSGGAKGNGVRRQTHARRGLLYFVQGRGFRSRDVAAFDRISDSVRRHGRSTRSAQQITVTQTGRRCALRSESGALLSSEHRSGMRCVKLGDRETNGEWNTLELICFNATESTCETASSCAAARRATPRRPAPAPLASGRSACRRGRRSFFIAMSCPRSRRSTEWEEK